MPQSENEPITPTEKAALQAELVSTTITPERIREIADKVRSQRIDPPVKLEAHEMVATLSKEQLNELLLDRNTPHEILYAIHDLTIQRAQGTDLTTEQE